MQPTSFTVPDIGGGKHGDHVPMVAEPSGVGTAQNGMNFQLREG